MSLKHVQLDSLKQELDRRYRTLIEEVRDALAAPEHQQYIELIDRGPADSADKAIGDALADINLAVIDRHVRELRDIEAARVRIGGGGYGSCADCGKDIGFERLQAYPTAKRCLACQRQRERFYAHEPTPRL